MCEIYQISVYQVKGEPVFWVLHGMPEEAYLISHTDEIKLQLDIDLVDISFPILTIDWHFLLVRLTFSLALKKEKNSIFVTSI